MANTPSRSCTYAASSVPSQKEQAPGLVSQPPMNCYESPKTSKLPTFTVSITGNGLFAEEQQGELQSGHLQGKADPQRGGDTQVVSQGIHHSATVQVYLT